MPYHYGMKPIEYLRATICYLCPMKCSYCYIDTYKQDIIDTEVLKEAVTHLLSSEGSTKTLGLIGGETFLFPKLLQEIIEFAQQEALQYSKHLRIYIVTSGVLAPESLLKYLSDKGVALALSLDGTPSDHNKNRVLKNNNETFSLIQKNIPLFLSYAKKNTFGISITVDENRVATLFKSFLYLFEKGLLEYSFTIVAVRGVPWLDTNEQIFTEQMKKILNYILYKIDRGVFLYSYGLISAIKTQQEDKNYFHRSEINIFPDGSLRENLIEKTGMYSTNLGTDMEKMLLYYASIIHERSIYDGNYKAYVSGISQTLYF